MPQTQAATAVAAGQTKQLTAAQLVTSNGAGKPVAYQMIPVPVASSQPVMMIQSNGGHVSNVIQIPTNLATTNLFSANLGRLV